MAALLAGLAALAVLGALAPALAAPGGGTAALCRAAGASFCHQLPARTPHLGGLPLAVCARCLGLVAGGLLGLALVACGAVGPLRRAPGRRPLAAALGLLAAHVLWGAAGLPDGGLAARALTGALAAAVFAPHLVQAALDVLAASRRVGRAGGAGATLEVEP